MKEFKKITDGLEINEDGYLLQGNKLSKMEMSDVIMLFPDSIKVGDIIKYLFSKDDVE